MYPSSVDYIVVGGGSAGCVMASRLSEEPSISVILIEAGKKDDSIFIQAPTGVAAILPTKLHNWALNTVPQKALNGRVGYQPRGKVLGGSSSINAMMYCRGHRWDYDHWASLGNPGWSYEEVLPIFKRCENNERIQDEFHGQGGPLNVAELKTPSSMNQVFINACKENGIPFNPDINGAEQFGVMQTQVTQINGERGSVAKAYLTPHLKRPNLQIITQAVTSRILFEGKTAVGVEFIQNGEKKQIFAKAEVILSAGAFGSPQILQLSGVGNGAYLKTLGIDVVADVPGVGENLQDHPDLVHVYRTRSDTDTFGVSIRGGLTLTKAIFDWRKKRTGKIASNYAESIGFCKSSPAIEVPDLEIIFVVGIVDDHNRKMHLGHGYSSHITVLRPKSRGTVKIGKNDPMIAPLIDPNFFDHQDDMDVMIRGWKIQKQVLESDAFAPYRGKELYPVDANDDVAIIEDIRNRADSQYHPVGTCKMGPDSDPMAVVDANLKVKGVQNLRVVDASIMPTLVGGNTNAPTVMIAEKAFDMIRN